MYRDLASVLIAAWVKVEPQRVHSDFRSGRTPDLQGCPRRRGSGREAGVPDEARRPEVRLRLAELAPPFELAKLRSRPTRTAYFRSLVFNSTSREVVAPGALASRVWRLAEGATLGICG